MEMKDALVNSVHLLHLASCFLTHLFRILMTGTTTELIIIAATFTAGDTHHYWFVLQPLVKIWAIITAGW